MIRCIAIDDEPLALDVIKLFCEKNCRAVRALTWKKLKTIFELTNRVVDAIRIKTRKDYRSSFADALMASAFIIIWDGVDNSGKKVVSGIYFYQLKAEDYIEVKKMIFIQ